MTMEPTLKSVGNPHRHPRVLWSRLKAHSHVFVWMAAVVAAVFLFIYSAGTGGMPGYVEIVEHPIASTEVGRVLSIDVAVGDRVLAGQAVAHFDASMIDAELGAESALYEEIRGTVPSPEQTALQLQRQFAAAQGSASATLDEQRLRQTQDQAELEVLTKELERIEPLLAKGLIDASTVSGTRARQAALSKATAMYPQAIASLQQRMEETKRQHQEALDALRGAKGGSGGGTNYQALAQQQRVAGLAARRRECVLCSPSDGVVAQVMFRAGDVVMAGTPVAIVVEQPSARVIGFIPEMNAREAYPGQMVRVERMYGVGVSYGAQVTAMEPAVRGLPGQVNPIPGRVMRGRRVYCHLKEPTDLLPGETVQIRLTTPFWAPVADYLNRIVGH
jgi:multidrug resistance efflux pump